MIACYTRRGLVLLLIGALGSSACSTISSGATSAPPAPPAMTPGAGIAAISTQPRTTPTPTPVPPSPTPKPESPTGRVLFTHRGNIWQWSEAGHEQITTGGTDSQPAWSPDGLQIAYIASGVGYSDLLVLDLESGQVRQLTQHRGARRGTGYWATRPAWSPDGSQIAYVSDITSYHPTLWTIEPSGTGRRQLSRFADGRGGIDAPAWTPDGRRIIVASYPTEGPGQLFTIDLSTTRVEQLTSLDAMVYDPAISPDGQQIAFATLDRHGSRIWVAMLDGQQVALVSDGDRCRNPVWSPDGRWLAYIAGTRNDRYSVYAVPIAPELPRQQPVLLSGSLEVDVGGGLGWAA